MGVNYFTEEQQEKLRENPYMEKISEKAITYTEQFRVDFHYAYTVESKTPYLILYEMGFDPKVLGKKN